jgi:hypothetical protein
MALRCVAVLVASLVAWPGYAAVPPASQPAALPTTAGAKPDWPIFELSASYSYLQPTYAPTGLHGWSLGLALNAGRAVAIVVEAGAQHQGRDAHPWGLGGLRFVRRGRVRPFFDVLLGMRAVREFGSSSSGSSDGDWTNVIGVALGAGCDVALGRHVLLRIVQADAFLALFFMPVSVRLSAGVVVVLGK